MSEKKYLDDIGTSELVEKIKERAKKEFIGTSVEWDSLSDDEKKTYDTFDFTDDNLGVEVVSDSVTEGDLNPVTSNAVANVLKNYINNSNVHFRNTSTCVTFGSRVSEGIATIDICNSYDTATRSGFSIDIRDSSITVYKVENGATVSIKSVALS